MKPGPRTKPTKLKVVTGNPGKQKLPENEPEPEVTEKPLPAPRELDKVGKKEWRRISKLLHSLGLLTKIDRTGLMAYCVHYSTWIDALQNIQKSGAVVKAPKTGFLMQSVYLQIANKAQGEMRKWLCEFGMTPSSRAGLKIESKKPKSKTEKFRKRKKG